MAPRAPDPFTDDEQLTSANKRGNTAHPENERPKGFETVNVDLQPPQSSRRDHGENEA